MMHIKRRLERIAVVLVIALPVASVMTLTSAGGISGDNESSAR
jgi:hypothetical protein